jgi:hypothetical protein
MMNLKSTLALLVVAAVGGAWFWFGPDVAVRLGLVSAQSQQHGAETLNDLNKDLAPDRLTRIEVQHDKQRVVLERAPGGEWTLPGRWPTRPEETTYLVKLLTQLHSRFVPLTLGEDLKEFGLDPSQKPVQVRVEAGVKSYVLTFGEGGESEADPFIRPTFLMVDAQPGVVFRLAPGLKSSLKASPDYYQKRRLFPTAERVKIQTMEMPPMLPGRPPQPPQEQEKPVELFDARALTVQGPDGSYTLKRTGARSPRKPDTTLTLEQLADEWELDASGIDRVDDKKLESILTSVPNIWAEKFVPKTDALFAVGPLLGAASGAELAPGLDASLLAWAGVTSQLATDTWYLSKTRLAKPERSLRINRGDGDTITLLIGKTVGPDKPELTPPPPDSPLPTPREEKARYAKLEGNDQIFEIKADKVDQALFVPIKELRDARLVRFRVDDARRIEVTQANLDLVLVKDKDQWRLQKPIDTAAETSKVTELLDKLSHLEAHGDDVTYQDKPEYGLEKPAATVQVNIEETRGEGDNKTTKSKTIRFALGNLDTTKTKVYVKVDHRARINAVEESVLTLVKRPVLTYRSRLIFDLAASELAKIEVQRGDEKFLLEQVKDNWRLAAPVQAEADQVKSRQLAGNLSRLEAVEYVSEDPKPADLDTQYGLTKPAASATLTFTQAGKPAQTLLLGKQRGSKTEYFAKLVSAPPVFVVNKELHDELTSGSLAYRPLQLWQIGPDDLAEIRVQKSGQEYRLKKEGLAWHIVEPFSADALAALVQPMATEIANPRAERYEAHVAKDLKTYGLDQPYLRVAVKTATKTEADKPKDYTLLIGKPTADGASTRFAKLDSSDAVVVVGEKLAAALDKNALDLLDRNLLTLDAKSIIQIQTTGTGGTTTIQSDKDGWRVQAPRAEFTADTETITTYLKTWSNLRADRFAGYGPKVDLAAYGLDKPQRTITVSLKSSDGDAKTKHALALGKAVPDDPAACYGRLDEQPGVFVIAPPAVGQLKMTYLDFADRTVWKLDAGNITSIRRQMNGNDLELAKQDSGWQLIKPATVGADAPTLDELTATLANLRAERVVAYPAKDLKPFGLDSPTAQVTLSLAGLDGKTEQHVMRIGKEEERGPGTAAGGGRFAVADDAKTVVVLSRGLADRLLAAPLQFRDRNLARFTDVDQIMLTRGARQATFTKVEGTWKLTSPTVADAEQADLEDFINGLARLRADQLVADRPADLKPFGLDRPEANWRFLSSGKEVLGLLVGKHEAAQLNGHAKDGPRCYAKLANGDLVFLLNAALSAKALGEYRSRSIWATLDAAQVETLRYNFTNQSFTLEKSGADWKIAGKPDLMVKPESVTETLDTLARLRAERYVVDKDADWKLYGLEPPQLILEIQTPSGKRSLHLGRTEGDSKRYYARVPDTNRSDVFIISETDGARLVRDLQAFVKK